MPSILSVKCLDVGRVSVSVSDVDLQKKCLKVLLVFFEKVSSTNGSNEACHSLSKNLKGFL